MGICQVKDKLDLDEDTTPKKITEARESYNDKSQAEQIDLEGETSFHELYSTVDIDDFEFIRLISKSDSSKIILTCFKPNNKYYAMKIIRKNLLVNSGLQKLMRNQKFSLETMDCSFIVRIIFAFQTDYQYYLVHEFLIGGDLKRHLKQQFKFSEERAKFYAACVILGLEYLHKKGIIFRDLSLENIVMNERGYVKLTGFGEHKENQPKNGSYLNNEINYLAPEIIQNKGYDIQSDWWNLGALLYEMISGEKPFYSKDRYDMQIIFSIHTITKRLTNIIEKPVQKKAEFSEKAFNLISRLLEKNPNQRLGSKGANQVKMHPFFDSIEWDKLNYGQLSAPFLPKLLDEYDLRYFQDQIVQSPTRLEKKKDDHFDDFSYQMSEISLEKSLKQQKNSQQSS